MRCLLVAGLLALVAASCARDEGDTGDGGVDQAKDVPQQPDLPSIDRYFPDWAGTCDPTDQNCMADEECIVNCSTKAFVCAATTKGIAKLGEDCMVGTCVKGLTCVATTGGGARCRKWCREDKDCLAGKTCSIMGIACPGGAGTVGWLCLP